MSALYQSSSVTNLINTGTLTISKPSGVVDGDLMIAIIHLYYNNSVITINAPAGWTSIRNTNATTNGASIRSYRRVASSEGSSYDWTASFANPTAWGGSIIRITDFNVTTPILTESGAGATGSTTSLTFADTVTPTAGYQLILFPVMAESATGTMSSYAVATSNPSWTELYDNNSVGSAIMSMAYATRVESTATGDSSVTCSGTVESWVGQLIVIDRLYSFSITNSETINTSDVATNIAGFKNTYTESITETDTVTTERLKSWDTLDKSSTTWINQDKT